MAGLATPVVPYYDAGIDGNKTAIVKKATIEELSAGGDILAKYGTELPKQTANIVLNITEIKGGIIDCTKNEKGELAKECPFETHLVADNSNKFYGKLEKGNLSDNQVLDRYKQIITESSDLMDDYSLYYEELIKDINPEAKDLIISIYNENKNNFESLLDSSKAQVYNAIFFAAASLSKPEIYGGIEAKEKLNEVISLKGLTIFPGGRFSQLKSFFDKNGPKFEEMANENSKKLKERILLAQKGLDTANKKLIQLDSDIGKLDSDIGKLDSDIGELDSDYALLKELQGLFN